jgi:hypothetical protein
LCLSDKLIPIIDFSTLTKLNDFGKLNDIVDNGKSAVLDASKVVVLDRGILVRNPGLMTGLLVIQRLPPL